MKEFIAVTGATASGKTSLSVELAERLDTEIISCDSMQIYKGMDVGTAKPDREEMKGIVHHMLDVISPDAEFSASILYSTVGVQSFFLNILSPSSIFLRLSPRSANALLLQG